MNISYKEYLNLTRIPNMEGAFGYLVTHNDLKDNTVIKVVNDINIEKTSMLAFLLCKDFIKDSGYPIDLFRVENEIKGYLLKFYPNSCNFYCVVKGSEFTYQERLKASLDCTEQLRQVHSYNLLFNDIALKNLLIDKKGGHLIDFDAITHEYMSDGERHYDLTNNYFILPSGYNLEKLKLAITNLSLIYEIDLEEMILDGTMEAKSIISLFKDNKDIYDLLESYLGSDTNTPYFDILRESLKDEEKANYEKGKIRKRFLNSI